MRFTKFGRVLPALATLIFAGGAFAQSEVSDGVCGRLDNPGQYGPFDYRTHKDRLEIVERFHFDSGVENLSKSKGARFGGDLDYTLRASPNHHRALMTLTKLVRKERKVQPEGSRYSIDCWFNRAERFAPNDSMVKVIYGTYLIQSGQSKVALQKLEAARKLDAGNANVHYNLGLAYVELAMYDQALTSAHEAYRLGFPLPGLQNKLQRLGRWKDAP